MTLRTSLQRSWASSHCEKADGRGRYRPMLSSTPRQDQGRNLLPKSTVTKLPRDRESTLHLTPPSRSPAARLGRSQEVSEEVSRGGLERSREASGGLKRRPREVSRGLGRPQEVSRGLGRPRRRSQKVSGGLKRPRRRSQEVSGGLGGGLSGTRAPHETRPSLP